MMPKIDPFIVAIVAALCATTPLFAQGATNTEPNSVFIPQAHAVPHKKVTASARRAVPNAAGGGHAQVAAASGDAKAGALPNGASSISETYGDWTVNCGADKGAKFCTLSQAQINKETGQRTFAIELRTSKDGAGEGTILLPFGLKLEAGVVLKLDDKDLANGLRFSTCLAQGCLLPVSLASAATDAVRKAKTFTVGALNVGNGQSVTFNVSLSGFGSALDRAIQLVS